MTKEYIDAVVDKRAHVPVIFHADFVDDEDHCDATMVECGCMVYPTIQEAIDAGRKKIYVRETGKIHAQK